MIILISLCLISLYQIWNFQSIITANSVSANSVSRKTVVILIPFRDRDAHAAEYLANFEKYSSGLTINFHIFFSEQFDNSKFNKGWVINAGVREILEKIPEASCIAMNDVDKLPMPGVDFANCEVPVQLANEVQCYDWGSAYREYMGGCFTMSPKDWVSVNGLSNQYVGWGGEDDDFYHRVRLAGYTVPHWFWDWFMWPRPHWPQPGYGRFACIDEVNHTPRQVGDWHANVARIDQLKRGSDVWKSEGLNSVKYYKVWESREEVGNVQVHRFGFSPVPVSLKIPIHSRGVCNATYIDRVPVSLEELTVLAACTAPVHFILVLTDTGDSVYADTWYKLVRWIRNIGDRPAAILAQTGAVSGLNWRLRDYPVCVAGRDNFVGIKLGSTWCDNDSWVQRFVFQAVDPSDADKAKSGDFAEICISRARHDVRRFKYVVGGCSDDTEWEKVTNLLVKKNPQGAFCLAKATRYDWGVIPDSIDIIAQSDACRDAYFRFDEYKAVTAFNFQYACIDGTGLTTKCDSKTPQLRLLSSKPSQDSFSLCIKPDGRVDWPATAGCLNTVYALTRSRAVDAHIWCLSDVASLGKCANGREVASVAVEDMGYDTLVFVE